MSNIVKSINPFSNNQIASFNSFTKDEITSAIGMSRKVQKDWSVTTYDQREKLFLNLKKELTENIDTIAQVVRNETGKIRVDFEAEIYDVVDAIDYYLELFKKVKTDTSVKLNELGFPDTPVELQYVPYGVIGLIMPWNFPFYSPFMFVITSILSGNSVLLKPSEYSTMVAYEILRVVKSAGFPEHILQIIPGDENTGKELVKSDVDKIFFVGSVDGGKDIMANAGIKSLQFELGGNSAGVVLEDADIDLAVSGLIWGATYHSGQDCVGIKRVFVHQSKVDQFIEKSKAILQKIQPEKDYGPYITKQARDEVKNRIDIAVKSGAKLLFGGEIPITPELKEGNWLTPSIILLDKNTKYELTDKETFGNVIPICTFETDEEVIEMVNDTKYGLSNSIFSQDITKANEIAKKLESGMVFINDPFIAMPGWDHWTGWKESGFGTVESKLMQCLRKKVVSTNLKSQSRGFWYQTEN